MRDVVSTFGRGKRREGGGNRLPEGGRCPGRCGAEQRLELGKDLFDGIVIRGIRGEEEQSRPRCLKRLADRRPFVDAEIVQDDRVARA